MGRLSPPFSVPFHLGSFFRSSALRNGTFLLVRLPSICSLQIHVVLCALVPFSVSSLPKSVFYAGFPFFFLVFLKKARNEMLSVDLVL